MREPRPATISARPLEIKSIVAKSSYTRTGSDVLKIVAELAILIFFVACATAPKITV